MCAERSASLDLRCQGLALFASQSVEVRPSNVQEIRFHWNLAAQTIKTNILAKNYGDSGRKFFL
jgi:hypothetical protein